MVCLESKTIAFFRKASKKEKKVAAECNKSAASTYYGQMMFEKRKVNRIFAERNKHSKRNGQTGL